MFSDRETENSQKFSGQRIFSGIFSPKIILENFTSLDLSSPMGARLKEFYCNHFLLNSFV
jgi:hypothetical protein